VFAPFGATVFVLQKQHTKVNIIKKAVLHPSCVMKKVTFQTVAYSLRSIACLIAGGGTAV
jgi:hypothetical protein